MSKTASASASASPAAASVDPAVATIDPTFGVRLTGYLLKQTSRKMTHAYSRKFLVLTGSALHWFKRTEGYDLFGTETGAVTIAEITDISSGEEQMTATQAKKIEGENPVATPVPTPTAPAQGHIITIYTFTITSTDGYFRKFRCQSQLDRDRWVDTITSLKATEPTRRGTLTGLDFASHAAPPTRSSSVITPTDAPDLPSTYLYHTQHGGQCHGGAPPPVPTAIIHNNAVVASAFTTLQNASFGPTNNSTPITINKYYTHPVQVLLSNGGCVEIDSKTIEALMEDPSKRGSVSVSSIHPSLLATVEVSIVPLPTLIPQPWLIVLIPSLTSGAVMPFLAIAGAMMQKHSGYPLHYPWLLVTVPFFLLFAVWIANQTNCTLVLHSYCESQSTESSSAEKPIPARFEDCWGKNAGEPLSRWTKCIKWRKANCVDSILTTKQPYFTDIKRCYPHFFCRLDLTGSSIAYYERPGFLTLPRLKEIGLENMVRHKVFMVEFLWTYMAGNESMTTVTGVDVQNVGLYDLKGVVKEYLGAVSKLSQENYPERASKICVLNAPGWFSMLWNVIKLGVSERVQKKVFIMSAAQSATLTKVIALQDIPMEYGGGLAFDVNSADTVTVNKAFEGALGQEKEACRWCSEYEVAIADYVARVNGGSKLPLPPKSAWKREDALFTEEEYLAGYEPGWMEEMSQMHLPVSEWEENRWPGCLFKKKSKK